MKLVARIDSHRVTGFFQQVVLVEDLDSLSWPCPSVYAAIFYSLLSHKLAPGSHQVAPRTNKKTYNLGAPFSPYKNLLTELKILISLLS